MSVVKTPEHHYSEHYPNIEAIPVDKLSPINMPEEAAMQEGYRVAALVDKYGDRLAVSDIKQIYLDTIHGRAGAYAYAVATLSALIEVGDETKGKYKNLIRESYDVRRKLFATMDYAYRDDTAMLETIAQIKRGKSILDLNRDLLAIETFGKEYGKRLAEANANMDLFKRAGELHAEIASTMARMDIHPEKIDTAKVTTAKAWTYLWEALSEIYAAGRFVFMEEPETEELFYIDYLQKFAGRKSSGETDVEAATNVS